ILYHSRAFMSLSIVKHFCRRGTNIRVGWIHRDLRDARVLVDKERLLPGLAAVLRAIDAALLLRPVAVPDRADVNDVRVGGMDYDARDASCEFQTHMRPGLAAVG